MTIDDIDRQWSESAYVWVRPASGDWDAITGAMNHVDRGETDWRPAKVCGFSDDQWAYGTHNDPRKVVLIGQPFHYDHAKFEIGGLMEPDFEPQHTPVSAPSP